jgi:hypothetical protein
MFFRGHGRMGSLVFLDFAVAFHFIGVLFAQRFLFLALIRNYALMPRDLFLGLFDVLYGGFIRLLVSLAFVRGRVFRVSSLALIEDSICAILRSRI